MKETKSSGRTKMWYVVDRDGGGKIYNFKPERRNGIWLSHIRDGVIEEPEPDKERLILPPDAERLGRTWEDEPIQVEMTYEVTIQINEEQ